VLKVAAPSIDSGGILEAAPNDPARVERGRTPESRHRRRVWQLPLALGLLIAIANGNVRADTATGLEDMRRGDYIHALIELEETAKEGDSVAQVGIAAIYHYGLGVPADFSKALQWYLAAALQGNVDGQIGLAVLYAAGQGVKVDLAIARMWLSIAADALPPSRDRIRVAQDRDMLAERMTPAELRQSDDLIKTWYNHHKAP
jgi:hypothetical protein